MDEVIRITSDYSIDDKLINFCKTSHFSDDPTAENMEFIDWENRPETLLNQIFIQRVYDKGGYFCLERDGEYVAGCGYYPFEGDENIAVCPVRLYVTPDQGIFTGHKLLQKIQQKTLEYVSKQNHKMLLCFVNEHNMWRTKFLDKWKNPRKNYKSVFPGIPTKMYQHKVEYKFTPQWAFYVDYGNYEEKLISCLQKITL